MNSFVTASVENDKAQAHWDKYIQELSLGEFLKHVLDYIQYDVKKHTQKTTNSMRLSRLKDEVKKLKENE